MTTLTKQIFVKITIPFQALGETATSRKAGVRKYNHGENWGETLAFVFANVPIKTSLPRKRQRGRMK